MLLHRRPANRTGRLAAFLGQEIQCLDFVHGPAAKPMPLGIIAAPEFLALTTNRALGAQFIVAAMECVQSELERTVVVRALDDAVLPELLEHPMRLFR